MLQGYVSLPRFDGYAGTEVIENRSYRVSKDQRYRGIARVSTNDTLLNLHHVREALDAITLDGAEEVQVKTKHVRGRYIPTWRNGVEVSRGRYAFYTFRPAPDRAGRSPRVNITAPCGETRTYSVRMLDRMLSEFGA